MGFFELRRYAGPLGNVRALRVRRHLRAVCVSRGCGRHAKSLRDFPVHDAGFTAVWTQRRMLHGREQHTAAGACCGHGTWTIGWEGVTIGDRPALYPRPRPFVRWLTQIDKWLKRYFVKSGLSTFVSKVYWETTY